jgi:hypothetical protein
MTARMTKDRRVVPGSCWPCRKRRVRCDLSQPSCIRCEDGGQACHYGLAAPVKWVGGMACRGRFAPSNQPNALTRSLSNSEFDDERTAQYFSHAVLGRFQLCENPVEILDIARAMEESPLRQTIAAVSYAHHRLLSKSTSQELVHQNARTNALRCFREQLGTGLESETAAQELFILNILFCMLDGMIEPQSELNASIHHLKGGFAMIARWTQMPQNMLLKQGLEAHLFSVFATMDLVHAIFSGDKPFLEPMTWLMFTGVHAWWGCIKNGDRFPALLNIFSEMACLGALVHTQLPGADSTRLIEHCLPAVKAQMATLPPAAGPDTILSEHWATFCALYEAAAMIFLERALRQCSVDDDVVQTTLKQAIGVLSTHTLPGMMGHCTLMPLLIIGAHCLRPDDQNTIKRAISPTVFYLSFGCLQFLADFFDDLWHREDMRITWVDMFRSVSNVFIF